MKLRILVVDDEPQIRKQLKIGLSGYGYDVLIASNGEEALITAAQQQPDMIILDISLGSEPDGIEVCRQLREWSKVPIIMLSVHNEDKLKVKALHIGADDYLTKPFSMEELEARIQAILRRMATAPGTNPQAEIRVGDLYMNLAQRIVTIQGEDVHLTPTEYNLLRLLATNPGKVLTHRAILQKVWGPEYAEMSHYVRVFINQLRRKLKENPARNVRYILNEPGVGYRFVDIE
ncbi:response regulator transcription factor [Phototrophicus methaneseepsis]|uniref:Response regulator transcription factor n=1 Tax=Phototrophicus methaneseepsis TaxID=2710758 RepID=A0A7S8EAJ0_9CHLR|nr:response regulator transcription factor [Phototrophicus methaneseepsis]QPC83375.1 response regulator transcription factor [Phototrophicus methaneseepsis]